MVDFEDLGKNPNDNPDHELGLTVLEGLSEPFKKLPSRLFYDDKGSELFQKIMSLEEYYPTRCEAEILKQNGSKIAKYLEDESFNLVELGCGDGAKTIILLSELLKAKASLRFFPLDISKAAIESMVGNLKAAFGQELPFSVKGLVAEYFQGLTWLNENASDKNMVMFLGSNIGNLSKPASLRFLRHLWLSLKPGDLVLIGFDLKKDLDVLYSAYNDKQGITREFNLNVLDQINRRLGGDFDRSKFTHQGYYSAQTGAMESYLFSLDWQTVRIESLGKTFEFKPYETIHMEYSYKYLLTDVQEFAMSTGFRIVENFMDSRNYFVDSLWEVVKQ